MWLFWSSDRDCSFRSAITFSTFSATPCFCFCFFSWRTCPFFYFWNLMSFWFRFTDLFLAAHFPFFVSLGEAKIWHFGCQRIYDVVALLGPLHSGAGFSCKNHFLFRHLEGKETHLGHLHEPYRGPLKAPRICGKAVDPSNLASSPCLFQVADMWVAKGKIPGWQCQTSWIMRTWHEPRNRGNSSGMLFISHQDDQ